MASRKAAGNWAERLFADRACPVCLAHELEVVDKPAQDVLCRNCDEKFEVKASASAAQAAVAAGNADVYEERFSADPPNLALVKYSKTPQFVATRIDIVPRTVLDERLIVRNKPSTLKSGRVVSLCRLQLSEIPPVARVPLMVESISLPAAVQASLLQKWLQMNRREWNRDVLHIISMLNRPSFSVEDFRVLEPWLSERHPAAATPLRTSNRVLQELRDAGLVRFVSRGRYSFIAGS